MTEDCPDPEAAEDGSIADLREDLASAVGAFEARAAEDMAKREDGVAVGARTEAEPGGEQFALAAQASVAKQQPFNPEPVLLVRHGNDGGQRPLPRRPDTSPPLRSASIAVTDAAGEAATRIQPGERYGVDATVANVGGVPARSAKVELFVEHRRAEAVFDRQSGVDDGPVRLLPDAAAGEQVALTGYTTYTSNRRFLAFAYAEAEGESVAGENFLQRFSNESLAGSLLTVNSADVPDGGRVFTIDGDWYSGDSPAADEFRIFLFQLPESEYDEDAIGFALIPNLIQYDNTAAGDPSRSDPFVGEVDATFRSDAAAKEGTQLSLASSLDESLSTRVGTTRTTIPQNGEATVSFDYEPSAAANEAELVLSVFHVRVSSLATNEVPTDWGRLDHTTSRFIGRTERSRTL